MVHTGKKSEAIVDTHAQTSISTVSPHLPHINCLNYQWPQNVQTTKTKAKAHEKKSESSTARKEDNAEGALSKPRAPRKPRAIPEPNWVEIPTDLDHEQARDRFFVRPFVLKRGMTMNEYGFRKIREFVLRFSPLMKIGQKHLEDLDEFDSISEVAVKALLLNILDLIAADAESETKTVC